MINNVSSKPNSKKRYLQIALNSTLGDAKEIIASLPVSDRTIVEAGTPLIKRYGEDGIRQIRTWYGQHIQGQALTAVTPTAELPAFISQFLERKMLERMEKGKSGRKIREARFLHGYCRMLSPI